MYCKSCGEKLNDNQAVCLKFGVKVGSGSSYCGNCGQPVQPNADYCLNCGCAVKEEKTYAGYDKILMALLAFFLGGFGVHNFLMGEVKKGVIKIITTFCFGIGYILALIDCVRILTETYEIDPEKLF